jgi:protein-S-isoprenylcysteine O-methyltransferase Ste14
MPIPDAGGGIDSWWALLVTALSLVVLVIRTMLEDRALMSELDGYTEYAAKVRSRLVPGLW